MSKGEDEGDPFTARLRERRRARSRKPEPTNDFRAGGSLLCLAIADGLDEQGLDMLIKGGYDHATWLSRLGPLVPRFSLSLSLLPAPCWS